VIRLNVTVEGQTEETFVRNTLAPYLAHHGIYAVARCVSVKGGGKGGMTSYERARRDITYWMREDARPETRFTTMFDLYRLPQDWPGWSDAMNLPDPYRRVARLEKAFQGDIDDHRFIPYIQLHEFEALLFAEPSAFQKRFPDTRVVPDLEAVATQAGNPELIDDDPQGHPSARGVALIPRFAKTVDGPLIAAEIGVTRMRKKCPHFDEWIKKLLKLVS